MGNGTIFKSVTKKDVHEIPVLQATSDIAEGITSVLKPVFGILEVLTKQNANLRETRDLLLPKLISGEIPVEAAEDVGAELMEQTA